MPEEVALKVRGLETEGKTTMIVRAGNDFLGVIALADRPRREAKATIERLRRLGIRFFIMLTGDNSRVAKTIAKDVGLTEQRADLLPDEKVSSIKEFLKKYGQVAMVGDGVNDAPAMINASVGIAMGASGTDVALETADVALMADDLSTLPFVVALSRKTRRIIIQNMIISLGVIALLIPVSLFGIASIGFAIIFHEGSTLIVVANALRLLRFKKE